MKTRIIILFWAMAGALSVRAQNPDSFEQFRQQLHQDYHKFRLQILENYDRYLEGVWTEYQAFKGMERDSLPKLPKAPVACVSEDSVRRMLPLHPEPVAQPDIPMNSDNTIRFYGLPVSVPDIAISLPPSPHNEREYATCWKVFRKQQLAERLLPALQRYASAHQFNDWFFFELTCSCVRQLLPSSTQELRIALIHYLMNYEGYDVRIGMQSNGTAILLVPSEQKIYARSYTELNGRAYYLFSEQTAQAMAGNGTFRMCRLPQEVDLGRSLDLLLVKELIIPEEPRLFVLQYGNIRLEGTVNLQLKEMLRHYPQMEMQVYAQAVADRKLRNAVVNQLREQIGGMPPFEAASALLHFVQHAFSYATDDEQHGFEKPYFFEEMFLYPQCDCEDRSIFFSYLLWHVLHLENQLIGYPGHEAVALHPDADLSGDSYLYEGKRFYIADPTYIGASIGMCMPEFRAMTPHIDYQYRKKM